MNAKHVFPFPGGDCREALRKTCAGIVDQDVDGLEFLKRSIDQLTHTGILGNITLHMERPCAGLFDFERGSISCGPVLEVVEDDVCAFAGETQRDGLPDPA